MISKLPKTLRSYRMVGVLVVTLFVGLMLYGILGATSEKHQGDVYRILYIHVSSALTSFLLSFLLMAQGIWNIRQPKSSLIFLGKAICEVAFLFTCITLLTGSLWGRPTWGVWWTWDARLTTTFLLALLQVAYLLIWSSLERTDSRVRVCATLSILIAVDIPIIYKSVSWWRTLHQPPSLFRSDGATMAPEIAGLLYLCIISTIALSLWLVAWRYYLLNREDELQRLFFNTFKTPPNVQPQ
ncbi:MAG: cytochrome c biogenesis protein CcsA [Proteobacteria bacterium]|nr:cytochrome c biogenesis protein CcsA [Pseudomonadota bacterium]